MSWTQAYDPLHNWILSTGVAALPILVLFGLLAGLRVKPHWCAIAAAGTAVVVAVTIFGMPFPLAGMSFLYGVGTRDPITFIGVSMVLVVTALFATYLPARKASRT